MNFEKTTTRAGENHRTPIYLVEDDLYLLDLMGMLLESEGLAYTRFTNGEDALAAYEAAESKPKLVISDFALGDQRMNGIELLTACKINNPDSKGFLVSGTIEEHLVKVDGKPIDRFLAKPFEPGALLQTVKTLLKE